MKPRHGMDERRMSDRTGIAIDVVGASVASKVTQGGAVAGLVGWLASINWVGLIGLLVAVLGLLANVYFQMRRDRREAAESAARIEAIKGRCDVERQP